MTNIIDLVNSTPHSSILLKLLLMMTYCFNPFKITINNDLLREKINFLE